MRMGRVVGEVEDEGGVERNLPGNAVLKLSYSSGLT
jgi:hypothetical protein